MRTTTWGRTGTPVSRITFGTWQLGGERGVFAEDEAKGAVRRACERGVNSFDTAQAYGFGASERLLGSAPRDELRRNRAEVVIATKGGLRRTDTGVTRGAGFRALREGVDAMLTPPGVDHIDLYQVHWPDPKAQFAETAGPLKEPVDSGEIRHVGVSASTPNRWPSASGPRRRRLRSRRTAYHVEDSLAAADIALGETDLKEIDSIMAAATPVA